MIVPRLEELLGIHEIMGGTPPCVAAKASLEDFINMAGDEAPDMAQTFDLGVDLGGSFLLVYDGEKSVMELQISPDGFHAALGILDKIYQTETHRIFYRGSIEL